MNPLIWSLSFATWQGRSKAASGLHFVSGSSQFVKLLEDFLLFYRICNPFAGDKYVNTLLDVQKSQMFCWNPMIKTSSFSAWILMSRFTGRFYKSDARCRLRPPAMRFSASKLQPNHNRQDDWLNNPFSFFFFFFLFFSPTNDASTLHFYPAF